MGSVARARDDNNVRSQRAHLSYDFVYCSFCGNRDDHGSRVCKTATLEKFCVCCIAIVNLAPASSMFGTASALLSTAI